MPSKARGRGIVSAARRRASGRDGGSIGVKVGLLPGKIWDIRLNGGRTVRIALQAAELEYDEDEHEVKVNGENAGLDDNVSDGDMILLLRPIQGN